MQEEAADEAERFAATLTARLRAEGNTALVSLRRPRDDGYATLVKLLAGQTDASKPVEGERQRRRAPRGERARRLVAQRAAGLLTF